MTETVDLEDIRLYLFKVMGKFRDHELHEDAIQEGMIRAWKDIEEKGLNDFRHVAHRAKQWALAFILESGHGRRHATGAPALSREGRNYKPSQLIREKISKYVDDFIALHGRKPQNKEVSEALGIHREQVRHHRIAMRDGRGVNHAITSVDSDGSSRVDYKAYKNFGITEENEKYVYSVKSTQFEDKTISEMDFIGLLRKIDPYYKKVLFSVYLEDKSIKEIAEELGLHASSVSVRLKRAHEAVEVMLDPVKANKRCRQGHLRTHENSELNDQGHVVCLTCRDNVVEAQRQTEARRKKGNSRSKKTHCAKGHEIRGIRRVGNRTKRYCKVCNALNNNPNRTEADISPDSPIWKWDLPK